MYMNMNNKAHDLSKLGASLTNSGGKSKINAVLASSTPVLMTKKLS